MRGKRRKKKNGVPSGGTLWAVRSLDGQINGPCGGSPNANCNTGCWEGVWRTERSQPTGQNGLLLAEDSTLRAPPLAWYANERVNAFRGGMKPFARKGCKGGPKIQSLSVSAGTQEAVPYPILFASFARLQIVRPNRWTLWLNYFLRTLRTREGEGGCYGSWRIWDRSKMLVANSIAFAIWGRGRDNWEGKTGQAFALKESARLIMCFFNEVVELFSLKRIHVETLIKLTEIEICQLLHNRTGNYD